MSGQLRVGAAKVDISPNQEGMLPIPQAFSGGQYEAVREGEELHARAIVIDNGETLFLFESFELGNVPRADELRRQIEEKYGIRQENMILNGTHNHSAPHLAGADHKASTAQVASVDTPEVIRWTEHVMDGAVKVVGEALQNLRPAKYGYGEGKCYQNVNRDELFDDGYWMQGVNWEGCSDKTLAVVKFVEENDQLIAAIANYAIHSVMSFCAIDADGKMKVTCDFPGICTSYVERQYPGSVVLWQPGAAGNQNPAFTGFIQYFDDNQTMYHGQLPQGTTYQLGIVTGQKIAMDVIRVLKGITTYKDHAVIKGVKSELYFPTQKFPEGLDRAWHRKMVDNMHVIPNVKQEKKLAETTLSGEWAPALAQVVTFGDIAYFGLGAELYNEIGMMCKKASPYAHTMIVTYTGTPWVGYLLDNASTGKKVFQSYGMIKEGQNDQIVVGGMLDLFDQVMNS